MKLAIVAEALAGEVAVSNVARRHDLRPSQLFGWIRRLRDEAMNESKSQLAPIDPPMFEPAVMRVEPVPAAVAESLTTETKSPRCPAGEDLTYRMTTAKDAMMVHCYWRPRRPTS